MAKEIQNPIEIRACVHSGDIHWALVRYSVGCEHEITEKRDLVLEHTEGLISAIHDLKEEVESQIAEHEGA